MRLSIFYVPFIQKDQIWEISHNSSSDCHVEKEYMEHNKLYVMNHLFDIELQITKVSSTRYSKYITCETLDGLHSFNMGLQTFYKIAVAGEILPGGITKPILMCWERCSCRYYVKRADDIMRKHPAYSPKNTWLRYV